jgi:hypothetical protein
MNKEELCLEMKRISDAMATLESKLPYEYAQHTDRQMFLAQVRQWIYSNRIAFGSIRESVKDPRNWAE